MSSDYMQIGEVAHLTGLSLRSIRYYEEVGLLQPSARSTGGFRLYTDEAVATVRLIMRMKPLGFTLDEMRDVLDTLAAADQVSPDSPDFELLAERLAAHKSHANDRVLALRKELQVAEGFAHELRTATARMRRRAASPRKRPSDQSR